MQKVEGSSPFSRSLKRPALCGPFVESLARRADLHVRGENAYRRGDRSGTFATARATRGCGRERKVAPMTSTIGHILPVAAQRFGARTALLVGDRSFSFADLDALSNRAANGLVAAGVGPGDRVALYGPNCWEWLVAYYAIAKAGAVVNPISSCSRRTRSGTSSRTRAPGAVVLGRTRASRLLDLVGTGEPRKTWSSWGDEIPPGATRSRPGWRTSARSSPRAAAGRCDLARDLLHVGTTGHPKGAMQSHRAVIGAAVGTVADGGTRPRRPRHQLAPAGPRLRILRLQRRHDGRLDADHGPALRRRGRPRARSASTARR